MKDEQGNILIPYYEKFISKRVEELAADAEKTDAYLRSRAGVQELIIEAEKMLGTEKAELLISSVRGMDIVVYEYVYRSGLKDGVWISGCIEDVRKSK